MMDFCGPIRRRNKKGFYVALWLVFLIVGGNANNGANDGSFYGNWNNASSNSNWNNAASPIQSHTRHPQGRRVAY